MIPILIIFVAAPAAGLTLVTGIRVGRAVRGRLAAREAAQEPAIEHVGATEAFGSELRALRKIEVSPELVSEVETELRWATIWHDFEATLQAEVDRIFAPALALAKCDDFDELRDLLHLDPPDDPEALYQWVPGGVPVLVGAQ